MKDYVQLSWKKERATRFAPDQRWSDSATEYSARVDDSPTEGYATWNVDVALRGCRAHLFAEGVSDTIDEAKRDAEEWVSRLVAIQRRESTAMTDDRRGEVVA